jgi:hypothetical protein
LLIFGFWFAGLLTNHLRKFFRICVFLSGFSPSPGLSLKGEEKGRVLKGRHWMGEGGVRAFLISSLLVSTTLFSCSSICPRLGVQ